MSDYRPIACVEHEKLEYAVLRRQHLRLCYLDAGGLPVEADVLPLDVYTAAGAEWLKFAPGPGGAASVIRLDAIIRFVVLAA